MSRTPEPRRTKPLRSTGAGLLLAGDIGGTKTNLALYEARGARLARVDGERFPSGEHAGLEEILDSFLKPRRSRLIAAAFGIAGPVIDGRSEATNLPWVVDSRRLARRLRAPAALMNDLEATAHAIPALQESALAVLNPGRPDKNGNLAIVAAGTGLGEAFVLRAGGSYLVGATEGGHCDFAPRTSEEIRLLEHLMARFGHVSVERVLSGPGLVNIHEFLRGNGGTGRKARVAAASSIPGSRMAPVEPSGASATEADNDGAAAISRAALQGSSPLAARALRLFASLYGAEAGNLALKVLARGGVYLGGGIAPKVLPFLEEGGFLDAFLNKGRFHDFLASIPVKVILDDQAALLGAARIASRLASG